MNDMIAHLEEVIEIAETWPEEDQDALAEAAPLHGDETGGQTARIGDAQLFRTVQNWLKHSGQGRAVSPASPTA
jgi:hypothetical protein